MSKIHKTADDKFESSNQGAPQTKTRSKVWLWTGRVLLASGVALLAIYGAARIESFLGSRSALKKFAALSAPASSQSDGENASSTQELSAPEHTESPLVDFGQWDQRRVEAYKESLTQQPGAPLAVLEIPKIRLQVPLLKGTDDLTLNHAVGWIVGTARPGEHGNVGIAGHRDGFFRGLKDVVVGDAVELKTLKGADTYIVDQIQIVKPDEVDVLLPRSVPSLTLVTCYPFYFIGNAPQRYIVMATLEQAAVRPTKAFTSGQATTADGSVDASK